MATSSKARPKPVRERLERARSEGRTQLALELAKEIAKSEATPEARTLLREVIFERGCQLLREGKSSEARVVFQNALALDPPPEFRASVAEKLAQLGDLTLAVGLFAQLPESDVRTKAFGTIVDGALLKGAAARGALPAELQPGFDAILAAFAAVEQGNDDAAREHLQGIGLASPFLEWKVMLRGLIAYHLNDDARTIENWQRLSNERQPWRLVAPFRFAIDSAFRDAQPAPSRARLQSLLDFAHSQEVQLLRSLERHFGPWKDSKTIRSALAAIGAGRKALVAKHRDIAIKLANLTYERLLRDGTPDDIGRLVQMIGMPTYDPLGNRLAALIGEEEDSLDVSIPSWIAYEADVAKMPNEFPGAALNLARALLWERIGQQALVANAQYSDIPADIVKPAECFAKSIELAPTRVRPYEFRLLALQVDPKKKKVALTAAKKLVAQFPDHAATWQYLGDAAMDDGKPDAAADAYRTALKANPMLRELRAKFAGASWDAGMNKSTSAPEIYRPQLEEALRMSEETFVARLATWVVLEMRSGHDEFAAKLLADTPQRPHQRIALPLALHLAAQLDKKLPANHRARFKQSWLAALEQAPTADEMIAGLTVIRYFDSKVLRGKRGYITALLPKTSNAALETFSEAELLRLGRLLMELKMTPMGKAVIRHGKARFTNSPHFELLDFDALMLGKNVRHDRWVLEENLERARMLALNLPREQQESVLKEIQIREKALPEVPDIFGGMLSRLQSMFGGEGVDDEDEGFF